MNSTSTEPTTSEHNPQFSTAQTFYTPEVKFIKKNKKRTFANTLKIFFSLLLLVCLSIGGLYIFTYALPKHELSQQIETYIPLAGLHKQTKNTLANLQFKEKKGNTPTKNVTNNDDTDIPDTDIWDSRVFTINIDNKQTFGFHIKNGWVAFNKKDINLCTEDNELKTEIIIENAPVAVDTISFLPYSPFAFIQTKSIKNSAIRTEMASKGDSFTIPFEKPLDRLYPSFVSTNKRSFVSAEVDPCFKSNYIFEGFLLRQSDNPGFLVNKDNTLIGLNLIQGEEIGLVDYQTLTQEVEVLEKKQLFHPMFTYTLESTPTIDQLVVTEVLSGSNNVDLIKGDIITQINNQAVTTSTIKQLYRGEAVTLNVQSAKKAVTIQPKNWTYSTTNSAVQFTK
jgi:hypothetical protein